MFDAKLKEGVEYFEQMLKVMPDDRTTLEFLAVAYPQMGETAKAESALAELARVLLKEGDRESAAALLPRLEACSDERAKLMAVRIRALAEPRPELVPETPPDEPETSGVFLAAREAEAKLAEKLGEKEIAAHLLAKSEGAAPELISTLAILEREKSDSWEQAVAKLADEYGEVPIPLEAFQPDKELARAIGEEIVRTRGIVPFAKLGRTILIAYLSPHDDVLKDAITHALGTRPRFYLADPAQITSAVDKLFPTS